MHLSRLKLDFFLKKNALQFESKQFREMIVNSNQFFDILIELINKLVLRENNNSSRSVIIFHGEVQFKSINHHVRVKIDTSTQHVSYHLYNVDRQLERFVDNDSFKSRFFKCYLHVVTAHCLIDELTDRIDVKEVLSTLTFASVKFFLRLEQIEVDLLIFLAQLISRRQYYFRHLQMMQKVT